MNMSLEEVLKIISVIDVDNGKFYMFRIGSRTIKMRTNDMSIEIELTKGYFFTYIEMKYQNKRMAVHRTLDKELRNFYDKVNEKLKLEEERSNEERQKQRKKDYEQERENFEKMKLELKSKLSEDKI